MTPIPTSTPIPPAPNERKPSSAPPEVHDPQPQAPTVSDPPPTPGEPVPIGEPPAGR